MARRFAFASKCFANLFAVHGRTIVIKLLLARKRCAMCELQCLNGRRLVVARRILQREKHSVLIEALSYPKLSYPSHWDWQTLERLPLPNCRRIANTHTNYVRRRDPGHCRRVNDHVECNAVTVFGWIRGLYSTTFMNLHGSRGIHL